MSWIERVKAWLAALGAAIEATEEGSYFYMDKKIALLDARVSRLESDGSIDKV